MLFSKNDNSAEQKNTKKQSLWGFLFNPNFGDDIRPLGQNLRMFARFMMYILASQKLFPKEHPAYADESISLSLMDVFRIAFARLQFTKEGLPQVLLFFAVVGCYVFSVLFVIFFLLSLLIGSAHAADGDVKSMFVVQNASCDLAQRWISYLFLGEDVNSYESCGVGAMAPNGQLIQTAIGAGLSMYSHAILVCAGFILLYHLATMIAETAHSGKPMGRANQIWAPIRLVVAIGLLIPIGSGTQGMAQGLNTAQFVVIQMAKWGSGLASNVWDGFLKTLNDEVGRMELVVPPPPYTEVLVKQIIMLQACKDLYNNAMETTLTAADISVDVINKFKVKEPVFQDKHTGFLKINDGGYATLHSPYAIYSNKPSAGLTELSAEEYVNCGSITLPEPPKQLKDTAANAASQAIYRASIEVVKRYVEGQKSAKIAQMAQAFLGKNFDPTTASIQNNKNIAEEINRQTAQFSKDIKDAIKNGLSAGSSNNAWTSKMGDIGGFSNQGWVMAGAWFNTIARSQGSVHDQSQTVLSAEVDVLKLQTKHKFEWFGLIRRDVQDFREQVESVDATVNKALGTLQTIVENTTAKTPIDLAATGSDTDSKASPNAVFSAALKVVDWLGEVGGLWGDTGVAIQFGSKANPLAEISSLGFSMISVGSDIIVGMGIAQGVTGLMSMIPGKIGGVFSFIDGLAGPLVGLLITIGASLIVAGITLGFYIPLIPFIKFFFNTITWILMVSEAVISAPLWALAHLTPYGDGLPGGMAQKGYFFLLGLLLRPILLIFGLVMGMLLFFIAIHLLNNSFAIATSSVGAMDGGLAVISKVIYSFIYVGFAYICANTCFKSITFFADHGLSWMSQSGQQAPQMGDAGTMAKAAGVAGLYAGNKMAEGVSGLAKMPGAKGKQLADEGEKLGIKKKDQDLAGKFAGYERDPSDPTAWRYVGHGNNGSQLPPTGTSPAIPPGSGSGTPASSSSSTAAQMPATTTRKNDPNDAYSLSPNEIAALRAAGVDITPDGDTAFQSGGITKDEGKDMNS